jgi:crotonobetaine/carnitine-CoA ligase
MTGHVIVDVLRDRAAATPDRVCCAIDDAVFTYADIDQRSDALAAGLAQLGVGRGERVAMLAPNRIELLELFYGVAKTGAAQVPLNAYIKGEFLAHQLRQSQSSMLFTDAAGREALAPLRDQLPELRAVVMLDHAEGNEIAYSSLATCGDTAPRLQINPHDIMSILYTSGTTGLPKGCVASHGYYCRSAELIGRALEVTEDDVLFAGLPLFSRRSASGHRHPASDLWHSRLSAGDIQRPRILPGRQAGRRHADDRGRCHGRRDPGHGPVAD